MGLASAHHPDKVCDVPRRRALGQNRITYSANRAPDTQHATFGATNIAVKQTDWSPVAPFCGVGVAHLRHKPTKSAVITEELSFLVIRHLDRAEHCTPRHYSSTHAIASPLIAKHSTHGHIGTQWEATNTVTSRWATNAKQPQ